ncbi:MAG: helix-turn-helix transcriptional regulator [Chitinophaga sp.]|uniref:helix-turn-helix domain-containing protein n=1 Tax=Chitinophaga sp. TaxID=1869181 RepID=UPI0025C70EFF|nr:helix-turn-helix domain-containing protein [Chitinophaga sp.]MBV8251333.1 helix-turn-helix transcriptional regulator [Chitinophaga sp.]
MEKAETILQYYESTNRQIPTELLNGKDSSSHFNILKRKHCLVSLPYRRRDYFKICVCKGNAILITDKGEVKIDKPAIFFSGPNKEHGWKTVTDDQEGFICLFNEKYISAVLKKELKQLSAAFADNVYPFLFLDPEQHAQFLQLFTMLQEAYHSDYEQKHAMIHHILMLIVHLGIKIRYSQRAVSGHPVSDRLVNAFFELLNNQFPVDSPYNGSIRSRPDDFARTLHVHVNYLNYCLKKSTGNTTSHIIQERIIAEAIDLLRHSDWSIAEIGYSLGFEYPQHFNHLFKKHTGKSPKAFRQEV